MPNRSLDILLLEDDQSIAAVMRAVLEAEYHRVRVVCDLDSAYRELARCAPEVILSDFHIGPQLSCDFLRSVCRHLPGARRVLVSGSQRAEWKHLLEQELVHAVLAKPFEHAELIAAVDGTHDGGSRP
jgi:DNA-binding NtrC family response regulator